MIQSWIPKLEVTLPERQVSVPLRQRMAIGSSPNCHIRLRDKTVPPVAGIISVSVTGIGLEPQTPGSMRLNGKPLDSPCPFVPGDCLEITGVHMSIGLGGASNIADGEDDFVPVPRPKAPCITSPGDYTGVPLFRILGDPTPEDVAEHFVEIMNKELLAGKGRVENMLYASFICTAYGAEHCDVLLREPVRRVLQKNEILLQEKAGKATIYMPIGPAHFSVGVLSVGLNTAPDEATLLALTNSISRFSFVLGHYHTTSRIIDTNGVLESMLSNTVTGIIVVDNSGTVTRVTPCIAAFLGTEPLPPLGRRITDLLPEVVLGGQRVMQVVRRGDRTYQVAISPQGCDCGWFIEMSDITRIEEAQRHTALAYEVYRQTPDITFVVDAGLNIKQASVVAENLLGECVGHTLHDFCKDPGLFAVLGRAVKGEDMSHRSVDCDLTAPSGERIPVRITSFASVSQGTRIFLHAHSLQEILKVQETALVQERMASLGTLAAGVAHEFNNLLATLEGYAELAMGSSEHAARLPELVVTQSHRAAEIVQGLLSFGREYSTARIPVDLNRILDELLVLMTGDFVTHKVEVTFEKGAICSVEANPRELQQVFMNILLNARQAIGRRGRVTVRTWQEDNNVCVSIRDNGPGISPQIKDKIFLPFFTTKGTAGDTECGGHEGGAGLGLTLAQNIVSAHKGTISAESELGKGADFVVRLPASDRAVPAPETTVVCAHYGDERPSGLRIFVVEDEAAIRSLISDTFSDKNEVILCRDADEAARRLKSSGLPDVILLDLTMEGELDGFGFFDLVKRTMPSVPVVIVTGRIDDIQLRNYRSRAQGFLAKPFEIDKLEQMILRAVGAVTRVETPVEIKGNTVIFNSAVPSAETEQTHRRLLQVLSTGVKTITLDLSRLSILHSGIAGLVVALSSEAKQLNISVQIACPEAIRRVLETTGIKTLENVSFIEG